MNRPDDRAPADVGGGPATDRTSGTPVGDSDRIADSSRSLDRRADTLRWIVVAALLVRVVLSLVDAGAVAHDGVRFLPFGSAVAVGGSSPFWPTLWAGLALVGAIGLALRSPIGWVLAGAACLGYLTGGIGDLGLLDTAASVTDPSFWLVFLLDLVVPAAVLTGLFQLRAGYVRISPPSRLVTRRIRRPGP